MNDADKEVTLIKQVIVARRDLKMPAGKLVAQGAHAAMKFVFDALDPLHTAEMPRGSGCYWIKFSEAEEAWKNGRFTKVVLGVDSEQELLDIEVKAKEARLTCKVIVDSGLTVFKGVPTMTCLAVGPDLVEKVNLVTGHLRLY